MDTELADGHPETAETQAPPGAAVTPPSNSPEGTPAPEIAIDRVDQLLDEVELALTRLDEGTYGRCAICGAVIDDAELATRPTTSGCRDHAAGPGTGAAEPAISGATDADLDPNAGPDEPPSEPIAD